jgi:hypothetical protein
MNDRNLFGRLVALVAIAAAVYGVHSIARGGTSCPYGGDRRCVMAIPEAAPAAPAAEAEAPAEKAEAEAPADKPEAPSEAPAHEPVAPAGQQ